MSSNRVLLIAVWFGEQPSWIKYWAQSCVANSTIDWLYITDTDTADLPQAPNMHYRRLTLSQLAERVEVFAGTPVRFNGPYKVCDFRPLFSCLTDLVDGEWDFWGHCDVDVIFGDVRRFLTDDLMRVNDRVFGVGHLSVYRNVDSANRAYTLKLDGVDYVDILGDPEHRGFDEHIGVNRLWLEAGGRFHQDESVVADLDPRIGSLRRIPGKGVSNYRRQVFRYEGGSTYQTHVKCGRVHNIEVMYVHFQKRRMAVSISATELRSAIFTPKELVETESRVDVQLIKRLSSQPMVPPWHEIVYRARHRLRLLKRRFNGGRR